MEEELKASAEKVAVRRAAAEGASAEWGAAKDGLVFQEPVKPKSSVAEELRIERIAQSAVELHPCVWAEFVEHACGGDAQLERSVVRRLQLRLNG